MTAARLTMIIREEERVLKMKGKGIEWKGKACCFFPFLSFFITPTHGLHPVSHTEIEEKETDRETSASTAQAGRKERVRDTT